MGKLAKIRFIAAVILGTLVLPILLSATFSFFYGEQAETDLAIRTSISRALWLSYIIAICVATGIYIWWNKKGWQTRLWYALAGLVVGFISWLIFSLFSNAFVTLLFFVFIISGVLMGLASWFILYFQSKGASSQKSRRRRKRS